MAGNVEISIEHRVIRLAFAIPTLCIGGAERQLLEIVRHLDKHVYQIHVVVLMAGDDRLLPLFLQEKIAMHLCPYRANLPAMIWFLKLMQAYRFDLIHTMLPAADRRVCLANLFSGYGKIICSELGTRRGFFPKYKYRHHLLDRLFTFRKAARVCANSQHSANRLKELGCKQSKIQVIHNGICLPVDVVSKRPEFPFEKGDQIVGMVARLHPIKAPKVLIDAAQAVFRMHPRLPVKFVLVGDGPLVREVNEHIRAYGLERVFLMPGYQADPENWIATFDVAVLTSLSESFPNSIMEYMALKKPVVASRVGGIPELVEDGVTGLLVPPGNPKLFAEAVVELLNHTDRAREMGLRGYEVLKAHYAMESITMRLDRFYRHVLEAPKTNSNCQVYA